MLAHHRELLASAYRQEQARQGARAFERQQTRIYNTFANQASPARFCGAASAVAHRANGLDSAAFALAAPRMLGELRASLR
jgi:protein required for attachment to host cells